MICLCDEMSWNYGYLLWLMRLMWLDLFIILRYSTLDFSLWPLNLPVWFKLNELIACPGCLQWPLNLPELQWTVACKGCSLWPINLLVRYELNELTACRGCLLWPLNFTGKMNSMNWLLAEVWFELNELSACRGCLLWPLNLPVWFEVNELSACWGMIWTLWTVCLQRMFTVTFHLYDLKSMNCLLAEVWFELNEMFACRGCLLWPLNLPVWFELHDSLCLFSLDFSNKMTRLKLT